MTDWLERYRGYILITLINLIVLGGVVVLLRRPPASEPISFQPSPTQVPTPTPAPARIVVYVCGAVVNPDVYSLIEGSRVKEAVEAAGGFAVDADRVRINLARRLSDGEQVYIPKIGEEALPITPPAVVAPGQAGGKININTASVEELDTLPGIGPAYAERIIRYREEFGPFKKIEDITKVRGIGDAAFEEIKDLITVGPTVTPMPTPMATATSTPTEMPTSPPEVTDTPTSTPEAATETPTVTSTPTTESATPTATSTLTPASAETTEGESAAH